MHVDLGRLDQASPTRHLESAALPSRIE